MNKLTQFSQLYGQPVTINGKALNDAIYGNTSQLSFDASKLTVGNQPLTGKIQVSGFGTNAVFANDVVMLEGKMYPGYGAYQGRVSYAKIRVISHNDSLVTILRRKFAAGVQTTLPEPLASFVMGLLIGQRATLPDGVKEDLLMVGLTHIIAVSGYNLTIMLDASRKLLANQSKRIATALAIGLMLTFLVFSGSSASIVRAAIVSMLSIWASYYGRSFKPITLLMMAAAVTAWANPYYVWSDMSWYLSFLAFYGVMVVSPLLTGRLSTRMQKSVIIGVAIESLAAEIMTLPYVLYNFGQMSLISLLANACITTLVPLAMLFGFVAGLAGMFLGAIAGWLALPAQLLLNYMLDMAHVLSHLPHIFIENLKFTLLQLIVCYVVVVLGTLFLMKKTDNQISGKITDRNKIKVRGIGT